LYLRTNSSSCSAVCESFLIWLYYGVFSCKCVRAWVRMCARIQVCGTHTPTHRHTNPPIDPPNCPLIYRRIQPSNETKNSPQVLLPQCLAHLPEEASVEMHRAAKDCRQLQDANLCACADDVYLSVFLSPGMSACARMCVSALLYMHICACQCVRAYTRARTRLSHVTLFTTLALGDLITP
jgi:hypothetical protein